MGSVAILRVLSVHSAIQQQAPQHCCTEPLPFLKIAQMEFKGKIMLLPILLSRITLTTTITLSDIFYLIKKI